jgi:hypothetical protein
VKAYHSECPDELEIFNSPLLALLVALLPSFTHLMFAGLGASYSKGNQFMAFRFFKTSQAFKNKVSLDQSQLLYLYLDLLRFFGRRDLIGSCEVS